jgi:hypothetical protein
LALFADDEDEDEEDKEDELLELIFGLFESSKKGQ